MVHRYRSTRRLTYERGVDCVHKRVQQQQQQQQQQQRCANSANRRAHG